MELFLEQQAVRKDNNLVKFQARQISKGASNQTDTRQLSISLHFWHCIQVLWRKKYLLHNWIGKNKVTAVGRPQNYATNSLENPPTHWNVLSFKQGKQRGSASPTETQHNAPQNTKTKFLASPERGPNQEASLNLTSIKQHWRYISKS